MTPRRKRLSIGPSYTGGSALEIRKHFDPGSLGVMTVTFILFAAALVAKGLTHDLLLEAGVFLVSVKLIMMAYKLSVTTNGVKARLDELVEAVRRIESRGPPAA